MAENAFEFDQFITTERTMLNLIRFQICAPNPLQFLRLTMKADKYDVKIRTCAKFFIEIMCVEEYFMAIKWSLTSSIAIYLAKKMINGGTWVNISF
jgi:hypothetical protein